MAEIKATFWKEGEESYSFLTPINLQTEKKQSLVEIQNGILKLKDGIFLSPIFYFLLFFFIFCFCLFFNFENKKKKISNLFAKIKIMK